MKIGDEVIVGPNLKRTNELHSVVSQMKKMKGKKYKIQKYPNENCIFLDGYMFYPGDVILYEKTKPIDPVTFDLEQLDI